MEVSGFTFIHNAIESGYPIIEAIEAVMFWVDDVYVVDMESTDTTRQVLEKLGVKIINGKWGNEAGKTLADAHALHSQCSSDIIIHFEADEVYPESLLQEIIYQIDNDNYDLAVWRLQLEQNFQRCRWYPELVHRVFMRSPDLKKEGHSTNVHLRKISPFPIVPISQKYGYLWDITNCFRDNWLNRVNKQAEMRDDKPQYIGVPIHLLGHPFPTFHLDKFLSQPHWTWQQTPFGIPKNLLPLVGVTKYSESESYRRLMK